MASEPDLLRQAVAVVLINQGKRLNEVTEAFTKDTEKARDWYHNYHMGALYWIISLYRQPGKNYSGFGQIVGVAGNNTRVALDLCYSAIEQWLKGKRDLPISSKIQDNAIHEQAEIYFRKLAETGQDAEHIYRFVERLGKLFEIIHKGPRQGEPEINHFIIDGELDVNTKKLLNRCRTDAILRWLPGNKQKSKSDAHRDAWQMHPKYTPFFNISWRRKKCLKITVNYLSILFGEDEKKWKKIASVYEKKYCSIGDKTQSNQMKLL